MARRVFSLRNPHFEIPAQATLAAGWPTLQFEIREQIAYQEQFLKFFRHLFENLQSVPEERPNWNPWGISLSLRAGAIKVYVLGAVSIIEGALAELAVTRGLGTREALHKRSFGQLLEIAERVPSVRAELEPIWTSLRFLKKYRNFIHVGNAANDSDAYWREILNNEVALFQACDTVISWIAAKCASEVVDTPF